MRCDAKRRVSETSAEKKNAQTYHERRAPRPRPPCAKLHLRERTALRLPRRPESPRRDTNGEPSNLIQFFLHTRVQGEKHVNTTHLIGHADQILQPRPQLAVLNECTAET